MKELAMALKQKKNESSKENLNDIKHEIKQEGLEAYKKTAQSVSVTYDQAVRYAREHYGTSALVALGMGVGMGLYLAGNYKKSRLGHFTRPMFEGIYGLSRSLLR